MHLPAADITIGLVLQLIRRLFWVSRLPGVLPLVLYAFLFSYAWSAWKPHYYHDGITKSMFPMTWGIWTIFLAVTPLWALLQLLWLVAHAAILRAWSRRSLTLNRRTTGGLSTHDDYVLLADGEERERERDRDHADIHRRSTSSVRGPIWCSQSLAWWAYASFCGVLVLWGCYLVRTYEQKDDIRWRAAMLHAQAHPRPQGHGRQEKIFITAMFKNNENVLPYWTASLLGAIPYLGTDNVFVSILESGSSDKSPELLLSFEEQLNNIGVRNRIIVRDTRFPAPDDMSWNNRISFLAQIRNQALEPLLHVNGDRNSASRGGGWDRIVFSNDIYLEPESWLELLETSEGDYDMACGLDFNHYGLYDAWVLRDRVGGLPSGIWPYFFDAGSRAALKQGAPVPVFACWNGITAFRADPLLPPSLRSNATLSSDPLSSPLPDTHPLAGTPGMKFEYLHVPAADEAPRWGGKTGLGHGALVREGRRRTSPREAPALQFRANAEGECYSSESFLLPYDFRRVFGLQKIVVNSRVISAYAWEYYVYFKYITRHWAVRWFIERVHGGAGMEDAMTIVGAPAEVWRWDGGDCQPWW